MEARTLDRRVRIERPERGGTAHGRTALTWVEVATVWANLVDEVEAGSGEGGAKLRQATGVTRVRLRHRADVRTDMRLIDLDRSGRILQIDSMAELGRRDGLELLCKSFSTTGD